MTSSSNCHTAPIFLSSNSAQQSVTWTSAKLRNLCCPKGSSLFLAMSYSFCSWKPSALQSPRSHILPCTASGHPGWVRSLWPQRTLTLEERGKSTHPRNAPLKLLTYSPRAGSTDHFCEHCSRCASCTRAKSRRLLKTFLVDVRKQIKLGIPEQSAPGVRQNASTSQHHMKLTFGSSSGFTWAVEC